MLCIVEDSAGKVSDESNLFFVYDITPPVLTVSGSVNNTVKVDGFVNLPAATATDNDGNENVDIQVCVLTPTGKYVQRPRPDTVRLKLGLQLSLLVAAE